MRVISPKIEIIKAQPTEQTYLEIETVARTCYASHDITAPGSAEKLVTNLRKNGHGAMLEFGGDVVVRFTGTRPFSHELVRQRLASFGERSQRYCNFSKAKFGSSIDFINPSKIKPETPGYGEWLKACESSETSYFYLLDMGYAPEDARSVLNNSVATVINMGSNHRHWREVFKQRCSCAAWTEMRRQMLPLLAWFNERYPAIYCDIYNGLIPNMADFTENGLSLAEIHSGTEIIKYSYPGELIKKVDHGA